MTADLARIGKAIGPPARVAMLNVLFDGAPHPAGDLAVAAGVTSGTASQHLAVLVEAGIVVARPQGRYGRYELANRRIAHALEQLAGPDFAPATSLRLSREQRRVRAARTCYDHLAGQLGVALAERFVDAGWVDPSASAVTAAGREALATYFGLSAEALVHPSSRRPLVRVCRDRTEQRDHLAGILGARIADVALTNEWVVRQPKSRALTMTPAGGEVFRRAGVLLAPRRAT
ncbi:MAG: helix-turn-helix transcriptional regulator [Tetrasphaera sp.]